MMTLVDNHVAILADPIVNDAVVHQALDDRHVEQSGGTFSAPADPSYGFRGDAQKC